MWVAVSPAPAEAFETARCILDPKGIPRRACKILCVEAQQGN
jgi:hypothetical protein